MRHTDGWHAWQPVAVNETYPTYPAPLAAHGPNGQLGAASCDTDEERKANGMSGSRWCQVAANETTEPTSPAPLAAHGPNRQLGSVACMRHMMGDGNPLDLGGLADDVTALYDHLNL